MTIEYHIGNQSTAHIVKYVYNSVNKSCNRIID